MDQEPILQVKNLTTRLQVGKHAFPAIDGMSFNLFKGKTLALVGESGCGKSMTALSILRILPTPPALPSEGEILYRGRNLLSLSEKEMRQIRGGSIAMIFQDPMSALNPVYSIGYQLIEAAELHLGLYGQEALERAVKALDEVGISAARQRLDDYPHQLSGGMKQRVMIAMALICEPEILIADESTTSLDVTIQAQVLDLLKALQKEKGMAILLITHDMGVVAEMADDVIVMYAAQDIEKGSVDAIFNHRAHPYTIGLFNSRPAIETKQRLTPITGSVPPLSRLPTGCRFHPRCPFVMDKCRHGLVPSFAIEGEKHGHHAKCWLHDGSEERKEKLATIYRTEIE
jgi:oligopeptide/dipeptide ABC transporter ATP-binding protein